MERIKNKFINEIDFKRHLSLCRLCLSKFKIGEERQTITERIENQFSELTQIDLDSSTKYSRLICNSCHQKLNEFTSLKNDWIFCQIELRKYLEERENEKDSVEIKTEAEVIIDDDLVNFEHYPTHELTNDEDNFEDEMKEGIKDETEVNKTWESETVKFDLEKKVKQKAPRNHQCKLCSAAFARPQTLENHQLYQHPETLSKEEIDRIKRNGRLSRMRVCPQCGITTEQLKQHIRSIHLQIKRFYCDHCDYATFKKYNIRSHVLRHVNLEKNFACEICGKKVSRKAALRIHMRDFHFNVGKQYICHCGREFSNHAKLHKHKKWKHTDSKVPCPHCGKDIMKEGLAEHMRVDPEDKLVDYICNDCNKEFPNKRCLNHHRLMHQERNYICDFPECNRAFLSPAQLQNHQKIHIGTKSIKCPYQGCDKSYSKQQGLKIHVATKHENYRKKCPVPNCTYESGIFQDMRGHVKRHKNLKQDVLDEYILAVRKLNLY